MFTGSWTLLNRSFQTLILAQSQPANNTLMDSLLALIPWLVLFILIWVFVFRIIRSQTKTNAGYMARAKQHMDAVEAKLDRLIELSERRNDGQ